MLCLSLSFPLSAHALQLVCETFKYCCYRHQWVVFLEGKHYSIQSQLTILQNTGNIKLHVTPSCCNMKLFGTASLGLPTHYNCGSFDRIASVVTEIVSISSQVTMKPSLLALAAVIFVICNMQQIAAQRKPFLFLWHVCTVREGFIATNTMKNWVEKTSCCTHSNPGGVDSNPVT